MKPTVFLRLQSLAQRLEEFHLVVDTEQGVRLLESHPLDGEKKWSVYLFVDVGDERDKCFIYHVANLFVFLIIISNSAPVLWSDGG